MHSAAVVGTALAEAVAAEQAQRTSCAWHMRRTAPVKGCRAAYSAPLCSGMGCKPKRNRLRAGPAAAVRQQLSAGDSFIHQGHRAYTQSTWNSTIVAGTSNGWPASTDSSTEIAHVTDVEDTLKLAAMIRRFRSRGHLVAQLDPLKRTAGGPWLGPIGDEYTRCQQWKPSTKCNSCLSLFTCCL